LLVLVWAFAVNSSANANSNHTGGDTTVSASNRHAFSLPTANMPMEKRLDFSVGNSFFKNPWVIAPSSTAARDGLGPLYNTNGCQNCHIRDGRGHPPLSLDDNAISLLVRLSIPTTTAKEKSKAITLGPIAEPNYGKQLQDFSIPGVEPEGKIEITYTPQKKTFSDGTVIELRRPKLRITQLGYGELHPDTLLSARIAPAMIGLGLLQAIDESTLEALSDAEDENNDGISGRSNRVWDIEKQQSVIGRFGWKAGQPNLRQQNAAAFNGDLGITSSLFPDSPCSATQLKCQSATDGGKPELKDNILEHVTFYTHNLAVPAQRNRETALVKQGQRLFQQAGCQQCHIQTLTTGSSQFPWLSQQTISPYTDLLLHDMGPDLADNRPEFLASGNEWRTAPLWGIGLSKKVAEHGYFLHDGRARSLLEAILWHGGEAQSATDNVLNFDQAQRQALIVFLESL
jgi:CxxC motif-containing protein (DUF1111 family)